MTVAVELAVCLLLLLLPTVIVLVREIRAERRPTRVPASSASRRPLLVMLEGKHDIAFLMLISALLHAVDPTLPDLQKLAFEQRLIFVPTGSNFADWWDRFAGLGLAEFHLYDREVPPLTAERRRIVAAINARPGCRGLLTRKRALENYLHREAIREMLGVEIAFGDEDDVPTLVARESLRQRGGNWDEVPARGRRRLRERVKKVLNTEALRRMTPTRLAERDPHGEVQQWLRTIAQMVP